MSKSQIPLPHLDGRTEVARMMRERFQTLAAESGPGLSYVQICLIERALWLELWLSRQERRLASGEEIDAALWLQGVGTLQNILTLLPASTTGTQI